MVSSQFGLQIDEFYIQKALFDSSSIDHLQVKLVCNSKCAAKSNTDWFLESIVICNSEGQETYFPCYAWLSLPSGAGQTIRKLVASRKREVQYELTVTTADCRGAGTDSDVVVCLHGENGDSGERHLNNSKTRKNPFERGKVDIFSFKSKDVGSFRKLVIQHDGSGFNSG